VCTVSLFVFTLGFHGGHAVRRLARAREVGGVLVVTGKPVPRAVVNAFQEIVAFCDKASLPVPQLLEVPVDDGGAAVLSILERLRNWHSIVADIGGGLRAVVVSTLIALLMACKWAQVELHVSGEREDATELRVQLNAVYNILTGIGQEKLRIVELLGLEGLDIGELSKALGKSERTVRVYAGELKKLGLVSEDKGKLFATSWGRVALSYQKA